MISSASHKKLAYDEYGNLYYGFRFLTEGPLAIPDGQRMPVLAFNAMPCLPYKCEGAVFSKNEMVDLVVRFPTMILAILLGIMIYVWSKELYGRNAALFSLCLYVFNPNFLAHGKQVTSDVATSLFCLQSVYFFWRSMKSRERRYFYYCVFSSTALILSKYSGVLIFMIFPVLWILEKCADWRQKRRVEFRDVGKGLAKGIFFCLLTLLLVNSVYLFRGSFEKSSDYPWKSKAFQRMKVFHAPVPLPRVFALGLDYTNYIQENPQIGRGNNYILGKRHRKGRWYAFPLMILLKTPLAFFIFLGFACFKKTTPHEPRIRAATLYLIIPFGVWLAFFSLFCHPQLGVRYVLPAFVFLLIYVGKYMSNAPSIKDGLLTGILLGWYVVSSLSYHPHYMSYFNEIIGPRINAYKYLADSNLDWEDKSYFLKAFKYKHPEMDIDDSEPLRPHAGFFIVGANEYVGVLDENRSAWLREFEPLTHITYSHYLFYVPPSKLKEALEKFPVPS